MAQTNRILSQVPAEAAAAAAVAAIVILGQINCHDLKFHLSHIIFFRFFGRVFARGVGRKVFFVFAKENGVRLFSGEGVGEAISVDGCTTDVEPGLAPELVSNLDPDKLRRSWLPT